MAARDRYSRKLECAMCGHSGYAEVSEDDMPSRKDPDFTVEFAAPRLCHRTRLEISRQAHDPLPLRPHLQVPAEDGLCRGRRAAAVDRCNSKYIRPCTGMGQCLTSLSFVIGLDPRMTKERFVNVQKERFVAVWN